MISGKRAAELKRRWESLKLIVGHCDVVMDMAFAPALAYWQSGELWGTKEWTVHEAGDLQKRLFFEQEATVLVEGDCHQPIALPNGGSVHIYGDLLSAVSIGGHGEIIIGGEIMPCAGINADGICHVFVGGNLAGRVQSAGSLKLCVHGDLSGEVATGHPSTDLRVHGDFTGHMQPLAKAALLYLEVQKFMPYATLESIASYAYTLFNATVGVSDRPPGIYPERREYQRLRKARHCRHWIIHSQLKS